MNKVTLKKEIVKEVTPSEIVFKECFIVATEDTDLYLILIKCDSKYRWIDFFDMENYDSNLYHSVRDAITCIIEEENLNVFTLNFKELFEFMEENL